MRILRREDAIAAAPSRWQKQYQFTTDDDKKAITKALLALDPVTREAVDEIIGNNSWTSMECTSCEKNSPLLIEVSRGDAYGDSTALCKRCLLDAIAMCDTAQVVE